MQKLSVSLAATALVAGGIAFSTAASALPVGAAPIDDRPGLVEQAGWAKSFDRAGRRVLVKAKRNAPKEDVASTGTVKHPNRPASQAGWGDVPGGPRRYGR